MNLRNVNKSRIDLSKVSLFHSHPEEFFKGQSGGFDSCIKTCVVMGRVTNKECRNVEGQKLQLVVNSTTEDAMVLELQNPNYNSEKWHKIKTFVMLLAFIIFSTSMHITNVFIFAIAIVLLLINAFLLMQVIEKGGWIKEEME